MHKGSCLCGKVTYSVVRFGPMMAHCHCIDCRKFHGAAFSTFGEVKTNEFRWLTGQASLKTYVAQNGSKRQFCEDCGSSMTFQPANHQAFIEVSLATLDGEQSISPDAHVFFDSRVAWLDVTDRLPKFAKSRDNI